METSLTHVAPTFLWLSPTCGRNSVLFVGPAKRRPTNKTEFLPQVGESPRRGGEPQVGESREWNRDPQSGASPKRKRAEVR